MAIAYAAKNPLHILIMRNFYDYLFHGIRENLTSLYEDPENIQKILTQDRTILEAIKARDSHNAYLSMNTHIAFVRDFFKSKNAFCHSSTSWTYTRYLYAEKPFKMVLRVPVE